MKIVKPIKADIVWHTWLQSEWFRIEQDNHEISHLIPLVLNPNFGDENENKIRLETLRLRRGLIIDKMPDGTNWFEVEIEEKDINNLFIIPSPDWFMDTNGTFKLSALGENLKPGRGSRIHGMENIDHFQEVQRKVKYLSEHSEIESQELPIIIATQNSGPYTIIDGTHRVGAWLQTNKAFHWKMYLAVNSAFDNYVFNADGNQVHNTITELQKNPTISVILVTIIDFVAFLPTYRKSYEEPHTETITTYFLSGASSLVALFALAEYSVATSLYVSSLVITNAVVVVILVIRRKSVKQSTGII